jgi:MFS transporter, UMF1 family
MIKKCSAIFSKSRLFLGPCMTGPTVLLPPVLWLDFFPIFFKSYWNVDVDAATSTARLGFTNAAASFVIAGMAPFLGAFADSAAAKKKFLFFGAFFGSLATMGFAALGEGMWLGASSLYMVALISFSISVLFYDSLLPSVSKSSNVDFISAGGYALGYLGGGLLLLINVLMYQNPEAWGFSGPVQAIKAAFVSVGLWWLIFSIPIFIWVKEPPSKVIKKPWGEVAIKTLKEIHLTALKIYSIKPLFFFMMAYWLYIDGVHTIIKMAVDYGVALVLKREI